MSTQPAGIIPTFTLADRLLTAVPPVPGAPVTVAHTCDGVDHVAPFVPTEVTVMGGVTGAYRLTGRRCDGSVITVTVDAQGCDVDDLVKVGA